VPGREGRTPKAVAEDMTVAGTPRILSLHNELPEVGVAEIEYPDGSVYKYEFDGGNVPILRQKARHEPGLAANIIKKIAYETRKTKEGTKVVRQLPKDRLPPKLGYEQTRLFPESMTFEDMINEAVRITGPTLPPVDPRQMRLFPEGDPLEGWYTGSVFTNYDSWDVVDNEDDFESAVLQVASVVENIEIEMEQYTAEWTHPEIGEWVGLDETYSSVADAERAAQEAAYEWISARTSELELEREEAEGDEEALAEIDDDPDEDDIEVRTDIANTDAYVSGQVTFYSEEFDDTVATFDVYGNGDSYLVSIDNEDWLLAMQQLGYNIKVGSHEGMPERRLSAHVTEAVQVLGPSLPSEDPRQSTLFATKLDASLETIVDHLLQAGFKSHQMTAENGVANEDWIPVSPGIFRYVYADEDDDPNGWLDGPYGRGGIFLDVGDVGEEGVKFIANLGASSWTPDCPEQKDAELAVRALRRAGYEVNERPSRSRIPSYLASPPTSRRAESLQSFEDMVAFLRLQESKNPAAKQILLLEDAPIRVQTVNRHLDTFGRPAEHVYQIVAISPDVKLGVDDTVVGYIDYTYLPSDDLIHINMIEVMEEYRRQGIGTKMIQALKQEWPDQKINWGMLVGHGAEFKRSLGEDQQTHGYACVMGDIPDVKISLDNMREQIDPKDLVDEDLGDPKKEGPWEQVKIDKIKGYHSDEIKEVGSTHVLTGSRKLTVVAMIQ